MGMFDSIIIDIKCPYCGDESEKKAQTKDLDCNLEIWRNGDFVTDKYNSLDCITGCKCGKYFMVDVELKEGKVSGSYTTTIKNHKP